jgi:FkbM family methyltransferase
MSKLLSSLIFVSLLTSSIHGLSYNLVEGQPDLSLSPLSEKIGHTWENGLVWDKPLIQAFYAILAANKGFFVAIDLGAQTGSFSLLAKYFPDSHWYAFEPLLEAADTLKTNLCLNDIQNVSVYQMAASDSPGWVTLNMPNMPNWGLSTIGTNILRFTLAETRRVECIDLDSFIRDRHIEKVHFMKLDTEGWEFYILRGAANLIMRDHPIILMEHNETNMKQCHVLKKDLEGFLQAMGYEWRLISSEDILCTPVAVPP